MDHEEGGKQIFKVSYIEKGNHIDDVTFDIVENRFTCICHMFEFIGILYRHILTVWDVFRSGFLGRSPYCSGGEPV